MLNWKRPLIIEIDPKIINKTEVPVLSKFTGKREISFVSKNTATPVSNMNAKNIPSKTVISED
ncbi:MAG TPA: hypothetical protein VK209_02050 [Candidatus Sulfotelmatobacter sp.]|nr:hypothetical protein [Candidatus Sulfotelmatobacter sp.]